MIRLLTGDCRVTLATLEPGSVQACITSPPYYGLRDYGTPPLVWGGDAGHTHEWAMNTARLVQSMNAQGATTLGGGTAGNPSLAALHLQTSTPPQIGFCECGAWLGSLGLEPTPELYIEHLVDVFRGVRRVLRDDGTLWVNLGDSYAGSGKGPSNSKQSEASQIGPSAIKKRNPAQFANGQAPTAWIPVGAGLKPKDLMMMPARVAMALQADGWWLRSMIPWLKRNSMPESVTDRPATAVEYWFLLSKQARYFWDADAVRSKSIRGGQIPGGNYKNGADAGVSAGWAGGQVPANRNRRNSDWFFESWQGLLLDEQDDPLALVVNPAGFPGSHFATFPVKLIEPLIKASTSEKGQCPECGAPWVRVVERGELVASDPRGNYAYDLKKRDRTGLDHASNAAADGIMPGRSFERATTGWRPSCAHNSPPVSQTVLDCFSGAGTVLLVADRLGRNAIGCELSDQYTPMATNRIEKDGPMFMEIEVA